MRGGDRVDKESEERMRARKRKTKLEVEFRRVDGSPMYDGHAFASVAEACRFVLIVRRRLAIRAARADAKDGAGKLVPGPDSFKKCGHVLVVVLRGGGAFWDHIVRHGETFDKG